jgi:hypothetical protein
VPRRPSGRRRCSSRGPASRLQVAGQTLELFLVSLVIFPSPEIGNEVLPYFVCGVLTVVGIEAFPITDCFIPSWADRKQQLNLVMHFAFPRLGGCVLTHSLCVLSGELYGRSVGISPCL